MLVPDKALERCQRIVQGASGEAANSRAAHQALPGLFVESVPKHTLVKSLVSASEPFPRRPVSFPSAPIAIAGAVSMFALRTLK
jgi:hypothetical protein